MKITTKVPLIAMAIILTFFIALSAIQYKIVRDSLYSTWLNNVTETSKAVAKYAAEWLDEKLVIIDMMAYAISENYSMMQLQNVMDNPLLKEQFVLIFGALEEDGKVFTPPYNDSATGRLLISAVAKIEDQGFFLGSFGGDIELQTIADVINEVDFNQKGYAFLLDKDGTIISHPDTTVNGKDINTVFAIDAPKTTAEFIETTEKGKDVLLKFTPLKLKKRNTPLMIGVAIDPEKVMEETDTFKLLALILTLAGTFVTSFALYLTLNQMLLKPLVKLTESADKISLGELNVTIDGTERNDEIGLIAKAIERLGVSISLAIKKLKKK